MRSVGRVRTTAATATSSPIPAGAAVLPRRPAPTAPIAMANHPRAQAAITPAAMRSAPDQPGASAPPTTQIQAARMSAASAASTLIPSDARRAAVVPRREVEPQGWERVEGPGLVDLDRPHG